MQTGCQGPYVNGTGGFCGCNCKCCPPNCCKVISVYFDCGSPYDPEDAPLGCDYTCPPFVMPMQATKPQLWESISLPEPPTELPEFSNIPINSKDGKFQLGTGSIPCTIPCSNVCVELKCSGATPCCCLQLVGTKIYSVGNGYVTAPSSVIIDSSCESANIFINGSPPPVFVMDGQEIIVTLKPTGGGCNCPIIRTLLSTSPTIEYPSATTLELRYNGVTLAAGDFILVYAIFDKFQSNGGIFTLGSADWGADALLRQCFGIAPNSGTPQVATSIFAIGQVTSTGTNDVVLSFSAGGDFIGISDVASCLIKLENVISQDQSSFEIVGPFGTTATAIPITPIYDGEFVEAFVPLSDPANVGAGTWLNGFTTGTSVAGTGHCFREAYYQQTFAGSVTAILDGFSADTWDAFVVSFRGSCVYPCCCCTQTDVQCAPCPLSMGFASKQIPLWIRKTDKLTGKTKINPKTGLPLLAINKAALIQRMKERVKKSGRRNK